MKRFLGILFPLVAIPTAIVILLLFAAVKIFPQPELRRLAGEQISKSIHRQVEIGRIHLQWNGITVDSLRVSEIPSFNSAGTLFEARGVRLGWHLRSLWEGLDVRHRTLTRSSGSFVVKEFRNPHYIANDFAVDWSLRDMDSSGSRLNGWAKLNQGTGALKDIDKLAAKSASAKVALAPLMALVNLERTGVLRLGLPNLQHWPINAIHGDYHFKNGLMTIRQFEMQSPQLSMNTTGTVELGTGKLALGVKLQGSMDADLQVSGTTSHPKVDVNRIVKKNFQATLKKGMDEGLKKLFR